MCSGDARSSDCKSGLRGRRGGSEPEAALNGCRVLSQGLSEECQYLFQPQLIVQRLVGISVLYPGYFIDQMIPGRNRSALYK